MAGPCARRNHDAAKQGLEGHWLAALVSFLVVVIPF